MKMSEKKKSELYSAISDPIMNLRIAVEKDSFYDDQLDNDLFLLETNIWKKVKQALNIKE